MHLIDIHQPYNFTVIEKVVYDSANACYASVWNQMQIRPCRNMTVSQFRKCLDRKSFGNILLECSLCFQDSGESDEEFLLSAACAGIDPEFTFYQVRDKDWNIFTVEIVDNITGKRYFYNISDDVIKNDHSLKDWKRKCGQDV